MRFSAVPLVCIDSPSDYITRRKILQEKKSYPPLHTPPILPDSDKFPSAQNKSVLFSLQATGGVFQRNGIAAKEVTAPTALKHTTT